MQDNLFENSSDLLSRLQEFCLDGARDINLAILEYPNLSLLESLKYKFGNEVAESFIKVFSLSEGITVADEKDLYAANETMIAEGGEELMNLLSELRALPIGLNDEQSVMVAVSDPTCTHTAEVLSKFLDQPVELVLARPEELYRAIKYKCGGITALHSSSSWSAISLPKIDSSDLEYQNFLKSILEDAIRQRASCIECNFEKGALLTAYDEGEKRKRGDRYFCEPEKFLAQLLMHTRVEWVDKGSFAGILSLNLSGEFLSAKIEFHRRYERKNVSKRNVLLIRDINFYSESQLSKVLLEGSLQEDEIRQDLLLGAGVFLVSAASEETRQDMCQLIKKAAPASLIVRKLSDLVSQPSIQARARYSPVIIPVKAVGLKAVLNIADTLPRGLRVLLSGIMSRMEGPQNCPMCSAKCEPDERVLGLLPDSLGMEFSTVRYPRGCNICESKGFVGNVRSTTYYSFESEAGNLYREGLDAHSVFVSFLGGYTQSGLFALIEQCHNGCASPESILRYVAGRSDISEEQCLAASKKIVGRGSSMQGLDETPLENENQDEERSVTAFHSVILTLGNSLVMTRDRLLGHFKEACEKLSVDRGGLEESVIEELDGPLFETHEYSSGEVGKAEFGYHSSIIEIDDQPFSVDAEED